MIASLLLGACLTAAGPDGPPNLDDLRTSSHREVLAGSGADAKSRRAPGVDAAGKKVGRPEHLGLAPKADPEDVTARGLRGLVRYRDEWLAPDAVAARVRADAGQAAALDEYHARRSRTPLTPVAQMELADWCEHRGLKAETVAHLTTVTLLDPGHYDAWKRLGCRLFHGRWVSEEQYAVENAAAEEQKKADNYWEPHLVALTRRLVGPDQEREQVERELAGLTDPRAVPAIWQTFVNEKPARLGLAVRLLGQIDSPESSRRLAALIIADPLWEPEKDVGLEVGWVGRFLGAERLRRPAEQTAAEREASPGHQALTILRHRDPRDFVGALIDSMQTPVTISVQRGRDFATGTLHVESETVDFRRTYVPPRRARAPSLLPVGGPVVRRNINRDYRQAVSYQRSVDRQNRKASGALRELTGQVIDEPDPVRTRDAWREWWADEQGYPYTPGGPRRKRKARSVVLASYSCFAAGTPVRTLLGLRPIESIEVGDQVLAQDITTGALGFEPVVAIHHNPPKSTLRIDLGDEVIVATPIHRFWKAGQGWAMARDLKSGDTIRRLGGTAQVISVSEETVQPVFNLDVAQCRSFFVGDSGALVHDNSLVDPVLHPFDAPKAPAAAAAGAR